MEKIFKILIIILVLFSFLLFTENANAFRINIPFLRKAVKPSCIAHKKCKPKQTSTPTSTPTLTPTNTPIPTPAIIVFAQNRPASFNTDPFSIPLGY